MVAVGKALENGFCAAVFVNLVARIGTEIETEVRSALATTEGIGIAALVAIGLAAAGADQGVRAGIRIIGVATLLTVATGVAIKATEAGAAAVMEGADATAVAKAATAAATSALGAVRSEIAIPTVLSIARVAREKMGDAAVGITVGAIVGIAGRIGIDLSLHLLRVDRPARKFIAEGMRMPLLPGVVMLTVMSPHMLAALPSKLATVGGVATVVGSLFDEVFQYIHEG